MSDGVTDSDYCANKQLISLHHHLQKLSQQPVNFGQQFMMSADFS